MRRRTKDPFHPVPDSKVPWTGPTPFIDPSPYPESRSERLSEDNPYPVRPPRPLWSDLGYKGVTSVPVSERRDPNRRGDFQVRRDSRDGPPSDSHLNPFYDD